VLKYYSLVCVYLTGSSTATDSGRSSSLSSQTRNQPTTVNNFTNCSVSMQQGNRNVMETSSASVQEELDGETRSVDSDANYVVVTEETQGRELDHQTLDALGVVSHTTSADQCSDDETYEKQAFPVDELSASPARAHLLDETSLVAGSQPVASQFECDDRREYVSATDDARSSSENETNDAESSRGHLAASEYQQITGLSANDADIEEDTVRKQLDDAVSLQPTASADDDDNDDDDEHASIPDDDCLQAGVAGGLAVSQESESVHHAETPAPSVNDDPYSIISLHSNSINEALSSGEQQTGASMLPDSAASSEVSGDQSPDNSRSAASSDQHTANRLSWLRSLVFLVLYIYHYATM